ncbi:hypothetical protein L6452_10205 [Arctium lappa]|uniref:Uncharacterized protein n=1 Tax=Arctium lappa TaxID=4217 RepID=A0ACB9DMS8_ARCLA|nr:hypothetical protein L6452_10205 [Arctium lappa]
MKIVSGGFVEDQIADALSIDWDQTRLASCYLENTFWLDRANVTVQVRSRKKSINMFGRLAIVSIYLHEHGAYLRKECNQGGVTGGNSKGCRYNSPEKDR